MRNEIVCGTSRHIRDLVAVVLTIIIVVSRPFGTGAHMPDDLKDAVRSLRSSPAFTVAALIVLTLGVGATTAIFSVVDAVVLRGLPFDQHNRLVAVGERMPASAAVKHPDTDPEALSYVAPQNYADWAAEQRVFESFAAIASGWLTLHEAGVEPESLVPQRVTASFFDVLRVRPAIGRPFTIENETSGRERVAVLSDALWRRRFGGDPGIVGRLIALEDLEGGAAVTETGGYEVVGVMPSGFTYPVGATRATDIWIPYVVPAEQRLRRLQSRVAYLQVIARLKPAVSLAQAQAQMNQVATALEAAHPVWNKNNRIGVRPLADHIVGARIRSWMLMLLGAVGTVLLIACANIATLLLARATAREREIGIRAALGATRLRLIRQTMIESVTLALLGTTLAVPLAAWGVQILRASLPENVPRVASIAVDLRVLIAAAAVALVTGVVFGVIPAVQSSRPDLTNVLKDGARGSAGATRQRLRAALVVAEIALTLVLLVGAALFIGSFVSLMRIDPGFKPDHVLIAQISPRVESRTRPRDETPVFAGIVERIRQTPGVVEAAMVAGGLPLNGAVNVTQILDRQRVISLSIRRVTTGYHRALGIPLRQGRLFAATDRRGAPAVVIINELAARTYFPGDDAIGRTLPLDDGRTIVGVVGDILGAGLEGQASPEAYVPMAQTEASGVELAIRTTEDPYTVLPAVRSAVFAALPDVPLRNVSTMERQIAKQAAQRRLNMLLLGLFGLLGLVISAVGIYGLMANFVSQRTREIGVRMALGATRTSVVRMVLLHTIMLVAAGLTIGGVASWYLSAALRAFLFRLQPTDPRALAAAAVALAAVAIVACIIPARRAAAVDPIAALRTE
jgi:putative ABC transport system permease protein